MIRTPQFIDGYFGVPVRISRTPREYPFRANGDTTTAVYSATYLVDLGSFVPKAAGTVDPETAGFYLVEETKPELDQGTLATFVRTYSNVPLSQLAPTSLRLTKPALDSTWTFPKDWNGFVVFKPDTTLLSFDAYRKQAVTADSGQPVLYATGGTYTITFGANTTGAIAYNANAGTVQTALNALASVIAYGSVAVSGSYNAPGGFTITFTLTPAASANMASLTGYSADSNTAQVTSLLTGHGQLFALQRTRGAVTPAFSLDPSSLTIPSGTVISNVAAGSPFRAAFTAMDAATPSLSLTNLTNCNISKTGAFTQAGGTALTLALSITGHGSGPSGAGGTFDLTAFGQTVAVTMVSTPDRIAMQNNLQAALAGLTNLAARGAVNCSVDVFSYFGADIGSTPMLQLTARIIVTPAVTGGTYTLTAFGQTTGALAYNASSATIQTALNALSNVATYGSITVSTNGFVSGTYDLYYSFSPPIFTGGTYTLTMFGQTTGALAYNASVSAIQTALNALGNVTSHGGVVVTGAGWDGAGNISFTATFTAALLTGSAASLTPSPCVVNIARTAANTQIVAPATQNTDRYLTLPLHGLAAGDTLYFYDGTTYTPGRTDFTVVNGDQIKVNAAVAPFNQAGLFTFSGKRTKTAYRPGVADLRGKLMTDYYLPGVTVGVSSMDDIALPVNQSDGDAFLAAVFAGGDVNVVVGQLAYWRGSILMLPRTVVKAADI